MRSRIILIFPAVLLMAGCQTQALIRDTQAQQRTVSDIRNQHILDHVAMFVRNPASLPFPCYVSSGVVQISDNGSAAGNLTWNPFGARGITQYFLGGGVSRTTTEQWALVPTYEPEKLRLFRCCYQLVVGSDLAHCEDCDKKLADFLGPEVYATAIPRGWFHTGCKHDVPHCARYVGCCGDVYVWVDDDGMDGLSRFTLTILTIAHAAPNGQTGVVVRTYDGGAATGKLKATTVQTTEQIPPKDRPDPARLTGEMPIPGTGLNFVPGGR